ncbi:hypothetical protein GGF32_001194 [Allomyces javanicus]|nr:hypothetical protein GGF32_001194 [Allomyces javanicus]
MPIRDRLHWGTHPRLVQGAAAASAIAAIATFVHLGFLTTPGPVILYNHALGLWFAVMLWFASTQLAYASIRGPDTWTPRNRTLSMCYHALMLLAAFISWICYAIVPRWDAFAWLLLTVAVHGAALLVCLKRVPAAAKGTLVAFASRWTRITSFFNSVLRVFSVLFAVLLTAGAVVAATASTYAMPGKLFSVTLPDGRTQRLHVLCDGPANPQQPVFWFDSSDAHGVVDFLGVQYYLATVHNRRSCIYDRPSFGWSDFYYANQAADSWYPQLVDATGEKTPMIMVGWGGGGYDVVKFQQQNPSKVAGVTFLEVSADDIEFRTSQNVNGWDDATAAAKRELDLAGRVTLSRIILGLAIPWGLIPIFIGGDYSKYVPQDKAGQFRAQSFSDKMWTRQLVVIQAMQSRPVLQVRDDLLRSTTLPAALPFLHVLANRTDAQQCAASNQALGSAACTNTIRSAQFQFQERLAMTRALSANALYRWCTDADCALDFPTKKARYVADTLVEAMGYIAIP